MVWSGTDRWNDTPPDELLYQWRMDDEEWSPYSPGNQTSFTSLATGDHRFEVRTIDRDGNVDATPATHAFIVEGALYVGADFAYRTDNLMSHHKRHGCQRREIRASLGAKRSQV